MLTDADLLRTAQTELEPGEKLLWSGRPDPRQMLTSTPGVWFFAIPWTTFSLFSMWGAAGFGKRSIQDAGTVGILFPLFGLPFLLIGVAMLSTPYWAARKAKQTVYAITDKRVLIIEVGKTRTVQSYTNEDIGNLKRTEKADGSGNLTFAQKISETSESRRATDIQFVGIPQVRSVEAILRNTFKKE